MCLCPTIFKKRILETCYSLISCPNKTKGCKLNLLCLNDLSKFCLKIRYFRHVTETEIVIH